MEIIFLRSLLSLCVHYYIMFIKSVQVEKMNKTDNNSLLFLFEYEIILSWLAPQNVYHFFDT